jgi:nicotinic acid phosphoribosyltransferase
MTKIKDALIARESMRHTDLQGKVYEVQAGEQVPRDHPLVELHPSLFLVASNELIALETLTSHDAQGNVSEVQKGEVLAPNDPVVLMHPTMVGPANYELEESA